MAGRIRPNVFQTKKIEYLKEISPDDDDFDPPRTENPWPNTICVVYSQIPHAPVPEWEGPNAIHVGCNMKEDRPQMIRDKLLVRGFDIGETLEQSDHHMIISTPHLAAMDTSIKDRISHLGMKVGNNILICDATLSNDRIPEILDYVLGDAHQQPLLCYFDAIPSFQQEFSQFDLNARLAQHVGVVQPFTLALVKNKVFPGGRVEVVTVPARFDFPARRIFWLCGPDVPTSFQDFFRDLCLCVGVVGIKINVNGLSYEKVQEIVKEVISRPDKSGLDVGLSYGFFATGLKCSLAAKMAQYKLYSVFLPRFNILVEPEFGNPLILDEQTRDMGSISRAPTMLITGTDQAAKRDCLTYALRMTCCKGRCQIQVGSFEQNRQAFSREIEKFVLDINGPLPGGQ